MGAIRQSVAQGLTAVQLLYSQSAAYAAKKEEAAAKVQEKRRAAEYKKASEELGPAIESAQEKLKYKRYSNRYFFKQRSRDCSRSSR